MSKSKTDLHPSMWEVPEDAIKDENFQKLYEHLVEALRTEAENTPGFGVVESMIIERIAFTYIYIRDRERHGFGKEDEETGDLIGFAHERNWKETIQMWMNMATGFQAARSKALVDENAIRAQVLDRIADAFADAVKKLPENVRPLVAEEMAGVIKAVA